MVELRTFRVMDDRGNTINFVQTADAERADDDTETRVEKRRAEAFRKAQQWMSTHFRDDTLVVVECDSLGTVINAKVPKKQ